MKNTIDIPSPGFETQQLEVEMADEKPQVVRSWVRHWKNVAAIAAVVVGCLALAAYHTHAYPRLSPYDEQAHADYLIKIRDGHVLRSGELMGQEAIHESSCRGFDSAYVPPKCSQIGDYDPTGYVWNGVNTAATHTPFYYAYTAALAIPISNLLGIESFLSAGRIASGFWLGIALIVLWVALGNLGGGRVERLAALTLIAFMPLVLHQSTTINPEAVSLLAGALVLWALSRGVPSHSLLFIVSFVAVAPKATNVVAVVAGSLVVLAWSSLTVRQRISRVAVMAAGSIVPPIAWSLIQRFRAIPGPESGIPTDFPSWQHAIYHFHLFMPPTQHFGLEVFFQNNQLLRLTQDFTNILLITASVGAAVFLQRRTRLRNVGSAATVMMILGAPFLLTLIYLSEGVLITIPPRYGMSLIPFLIAGIAAAQLNRIGRTVLVALALITAVNTLYLMSTSEYERGYPPETYEAG
jgi:hypothetical protein